MLLDCPPSLGLLTVNALVAADHALLTAEAQYFAMQGVEQALEVIELARDSLNPDLSWLGVVLNIADMRTRPLARGVRSRSREAFGDKLFETTIRQSIAYAESAERAVSILDHRPDLGADYIALADELLARLDLPEARQRLGALELAGAMTRAASAAALAGLVAEPRGLRRRGPVGEWRGTAHHAGSEAPAARAAGGRAGRRHASRPT